jgi:hypothetical protein
VAHSRYVLTVSELLDVRDQENVGLAPHQSKAEPITKTQVIHATPKVR